MAKFRLWELSSLPTITLLSTFSKFSNNLVHFEQLISSLQISTSCTHRVIVHYCQLTVTPLSSLVLLNLTCVQVQVMLHYQYLPWHIITAAIKCSMCWICIREIILPLLERRCSINRDQIIRELTVAITWLNFNSKNI